MSKNIIICSDGTGNSAVKGRGTNVFKLFEAIDLNGHRRGAFTVRTLADIIDKCSILDAQKLITADKLGISLVGIPGLSREISVFLLTFLIMDVPGIPHGGIRGVAITCFHR